MDYPIRRKDRIMPEEDAWALLRGGEYGTLATVGADGQPYAVPVSYVVMDGRIYFHCARSGRKLEHIAFCPKVCFCVVGKTQPVYDNGFSTYYESAVVFGSAREVADTEPAWLESLLRLAEKYLPGHMDKAEGSIAKAKQRTAVYAISIDRISGKAKRKKPDPD
jgi:nitroimidazol reductase NimA-like FMN-containing flavoprotein (pyridoxamine 5'-phosphate oxidase superfamily)